MHACNISFKMINYQEQEELQNLGFLGILKESLKLIFSRKKIFTQITLSLILPYSIIGFVELKVFQLIVNDIKKYDNKLDNMDKNTFKYAKTFMAIVSFETSTYMNLLIVYAAFSYTLNLLSTSSVTYTIACIYTDEEITFRKVVSISPKVGKRLIITFIWIIAIDFVYVIVPGALILALPALTGTRRIGRVIFLLLVIMYVIGFIYFNLVCRLANMVSVLEDYGFRAVIKSFALMKGKIAVFVGFFILRRLSFIATQLAFRKFLVPSILRTGIQILCSLFPLPLNLLDYVAQPVVYFVCKSYHHETIDRNSLADHLDGLLGKPKDIVPTGGDSFEAHVV
jgi:hypothetical protein